ncbi:MAG: SusC/RagA family TonB-linked outer membrane protein [Bacteroidales bacterium]
MIKKKIYQYGLMLFFLLGITFPSYAQIVIKGKAANANGEPLAGVSVVIKGTYSGTITDMNGNYSIAVEKQDAVLVFSFVGYTTMEKIVGEQIRIDVVLETETKGIDEVVVVGYGTQTKVTMTGAVSQISEGELKRAPMQDVSNMLTGKLPGLTSIQKSGKPGDDAATMYIRGLNSFGGSNSPMVVVDGVPRAMSYINPNDIATVSVLKDAAAAIYGVQGANGVILITTKSGGESVPVISYDGSYTFTQNTAMPEMLNAPDYMYWHNKAREMDGLSPVWDASIQNKVMRNDPESIWGQTNWLDKIFQTGATQQHNVSATGGTKKVKYFASLGYLNQEGTLKNTEFERFNIRTNLDVEVAKNLKFVMGVSGYKTNRNWPGANISNQAEVNPIRQAINTIPIIKPEFKGLNTGWNNGYNIVNGYAALTESGFKKQNRWYFDANFKLAYDFSGITEALKGLKASMFAAYNYAHTTDNNYNRYYELYTVNNNSDEVVTGASGLVEGGSFWKASSGGDTYMLRPQIDYSRSFGKHDVHALFLYEMQKTASSTLQASKRGYYADEPIDISIGILPSEEVPSGSHEESARASWAGRLNYSFNKKYLAEFTFRRDGSYIFAPENRWGFFPSVSVGWVASDEDFFASALPAIDFFKLRASYGQSGNDDVTAFLYNSTYGNSQNSMVFGDKAITQFFAKNSYIYRDLTWATTHSYNVGFDLNMWEGMLDVEFDYFYKLTEDILENQNGSYPPSLGGYAPSFRNSGKVSNKGFELAVAHRNHIGTDWSYNLTANLAFSRNKVLSRVVTDNVPSYRYPLGESMNARYGFQAEGLFQKQEEIDRYPVPPSGEKRLGDIKYKDINGDGVINEQYDYVRTGYGEVPEISFSVDMGVKYKDFYLSMLWQGVTNTDYELSGVYGTGVTSSTVYTSSFTSNGNSPKYLIEDAWTPENTSARYPRLTTVGNGNNAWRSSWWVVNGEYLRLKNATIGYDVPKSLLQKINWISGVNIYVAGTNLLTFSHFKYVDPESPSVSNGYYPQQRTYSIGVKATF